MRRLYALFIAFVIFIQLSLSVFAVGNNSEKITVYVDGVLIDPGKDPMIVNSRAMAPIRAVAEACGMNVGWNNDKRLVTVSHDYLSVSMVIDSDEMKVYNSIIDSLETVKLEAAPVIVDSTTYVALRAPLEYLGAKVEWDNGRRCISITSPKALSEKNTPQETAPEDSSDKDSTTPSENMSGTAPEQNEGSADESTQPVPPVTGEDASSDGSDSDVTADADKSDTKEDASETDGSDTLTGEKDSEPSDSSTDTSDTEPQDQPSDTEKTEAADENAQDAPTNTEGDNGLAAPDAEDKPEAPAENSPENGTSPEETPKFTYTGFREMEGHTIIEHAPHGLYGRIKATEPITLVRCRIVGTKMDYVLFFKKEDNLRNYNVFTYFDKLICFSDAGLGAHTLEILAGVNGGEQQVVFTYDYTVVSETDPYPDVSGGNQAIPDGGSDTSADSEGAPSDVGSGNNPASGDVTEETPENKDNENDGTGSATENIPDNTEGTDPVTDTESETENIPDNTNDAEPENGASSENKEPEKTPTEKPYREPGPRVEQDEPPKSDTEDKDDKPNDTKPEPDNVPDSDKDKEPEKAPDNKDDSGKENTSDPEEAPKEKPYRKPGPRVEQDEPSDEDDDYNKGRDDKDSSNDNDDVSQNRGKTDVAVSYHGFRKMTNDSVVKGAPHGLYGNIVSNCPITFVRCRINGTDMDYSLEFSAKDNITTYNVFTYFDQLIRFSDAGLGKQSFEIFVGAGGETPGLLFKYNYTVTEKGATPPTSQTKPTTPSEKPDSTTGSVTMSDVCLPLEGTIKVTSPYGFRAYNKWEFHKGVDIISTSSLNIIAVADGTVVDCATGRNSGVGNYVAIQHTGGWVSLYYHLASYDVEIGDKVKKGDRFAIMGNTGGNYGVHLHFMTCDNWYGGIWATQNNHHTPPHEYVPWLLDEAVYYNPSFEKVNSDKMILCSFLFPTRLQQGSSFAISKNGAFVASENPLQSITLTVSDKDGNELICETVEEPTYWNQDIYTYTNISTELDKKCEFDKLPIGKMKVTVTAVSTLGRERQIYEKEFEVVGRDVDIDETEGLTPEEASKTDAFEKKDGE